jgi:tRNA-2-methylthio-N6-dimethylallyladenosine synthase
VLITDAMSNSLRGRIVLDEPTVDAPVALAS